MFSTIKDIVEFENTFLVLKSNQKKSMEELLELKRLKEVEEGEGGREEGDKDLERMERCKNKLK